MIPFDLWMIMSDKFLIAIDISLCQSVLFGIIKLFEELLALGNVIKIWF